MGFWETLIDALITSAKSGWFGLLLVIVIIALTSTLVGLPVWGLFVAIDSWGVPTMQAPGKITRKDFYSENTKMLDTWKVSVSCKAGAGTMKVNQEYYNAIHPGENVTVHYKLGRISGWMYVQTLSS